MAFMWAFKNGKILEIIMSGLYDTYSENNYKMLINKKKNYCPIKKQLVIPLLGKNTIANINFFLYAETYTFIIFIINVQFSYNFLPICSMFTSFWNLFSDYNVIICVYLIKKLSFCGIFYF